MNHPKNSSKPRSSIGAQKTEKAPVTVAEVSALIKKLHLLALQDPDKAAKILTAWMNEKYSK